MGLENAIKHLEETIGSGELCGACLEEHKELLGYLKELLHYKSNPQTATENPIRYMDDLGRIAIPKTIRKQFAGREDLTGMAFEIYVKDDRIVLKEKFIG